MLITNIHLVMSISFKQKLIIDYPIPMSLSVWGGDDVTTCPLANLDELIESSVDELASDVLMTDFVQASGMNTNMPEDTVSIAAVKLLMSFQGNRFVKFTYDESSKVCSVRFFPAVITYKRKFRIEDLEIITGDRLRFIKAYMLWHMAQKEIQILKVVNLDSDNGSINLDQLQEFADMHEDIYNELKTEILIYGTAP